MACYSSLAFLFFCLCSFSLTEVLGFSVELIHRDSSRSPFYLPTETHTQRIVNAIRRSINRANHFNQYFISTNTIKSTVTPDQGEYLMSYSVGTPPFQQVGIVDTGSTLVWLQCKPCEICYNQTSPIFDPSQSTTYNTIPCTSDTCHSVKYTSCSSNDQQICQYNVEYLGTQRTSGDLSLETLTLDSTSGSPIRFPKFVIGCGHNNPYPVPIHTQSSGIVGLGNGPLSFITQMSSSIGGKFSYCLVPMFPQSSTSSKLNFGDDAVVSGDEAVSIPMVVVEQFKGFYNLNMSAFSVGDNRIEFGGSSYSSGGNVVAIVDSGSALTILPPDLYLKLESAVAKVLNLERTKDPTGTMLLCYKATLEKIHVPIMTAHFNDADVQLNSINTFVQVADEVVCLAFVSLDFPAIIFGNVAQQNFLVGYDLQKNIVSFKPTDCTKY